MGVNGGKDIGLSRAARPQPSPAPAIARSRGQALHRASAQETSSRIFSRCAISSSAPSARTWQDARLPDLAARIREHGAIDAPMRPRSGR